jgi:hypothetical protein
MAQGKKLFKNTTNQPLEVTLVVRQGDNPGNDAGTLNFKLAAGQSLTQTYGTDTNSVFLDGMTVAVVTRGSSLDDLLNTNSTITFASAAGNAISIAGTNP